MKSLQIFLVTSLFFGISLAKDGEPLPAKSYQISCNFQDGMCNWTDDLIAKTKFTITSNMPNVSNPPKGCKYLILSSNSKSGIETNEAILNSPEFTTLQSMVALQINISYWIKNDNNTAQLKLSMTPLEGHSNGTMTNLWSTGDGQASSKHWNITTIYAKQLRSAQKLKLSLHGIISGMTEFVAINEINVTEISATDVPDVETLPDATYILSNHSTCTSGATTFPLNMYMWLIALVMLYSFV